MLCTVLPTGADNYELEKKRECNYFGCIYAKETNILHGLSVGPLYMTVLLALSFISTIMIFLELMLIQGEHNCVNVIGNEVIAL